MFSPSQIAIAPAAVRAAEHLRRLYPRAAAILFYGSCLRDRTADGLLDFYVLVERYRDVMGRTAAAAARLLPPNVYYHDLGEARAKVAVMRLDRFLAALQPSCFTSTLSARFAQPAAIVFIRDPALRRPLENGFGAAAATTIARTLPLMPERFTARDLWRRAFRESFAAELRPEPEARIDALVDAGLDAYTALTRRSLGSIDGPYRQPAQPWRRRRAAAMWFCRRIAGKTLNALRLVKAAFTFKGGLDYAAWKIRRHSGVEIVITAADRRKPLRAGLRLFALALHRGGIR